METPGGFRWRRTNAPIASWRTDDIWFRDADRGWAVNSNGHVLHTRDGGETWQRQLTAPGGTYLRCVGFADERRGWVGALTEAHRLFHTSDGGATWSRVGNLPPQAPHGLCGLSVVNERVVYGCGTNFPDSPPGLIKTVDGGATWAAVDMRPHACLLVDLHFVDERRGWVVGARADVPDPKRDDVIPVVLFTEDGGRTWVNRLAGSRLPKGEWAWKIQFPNERVGLVSLESFERGAILKTVDGGLTWARKAVDDPQHNINLEGIGFVDDKLGWAGGWGTASFLGGFTSETRDGGESWTSANHVGKFLNRFRFIREPELVGYASGDTVYRYSASPHPGETEPSTADADPAEAPTSTRLPIRIPVSPEKGAQHLRVDIWDRFGKHIATPLAEARPAEGARDVYWPAGTDSARAPDPGVYIYRVAIDDWATSRAVLVEGD